MESRKSSKKLPGDPRSDRRYTASGADSVKLATGHVVVDTQAAHGVNVTGTKLNVVKVINQIKIGNWNVRGLVTNPGKLLITEKEMIRCSIDVCGLCETHWQGSGHFMTEQHCIYHSGHSSKSINGVAITIPKYLNNSVLGYEPINDRMISVRIRANPINLNIIQVYAPTSTANDEDIEEFYTALESAMLKVSNREILIISGDFNAKIGKPAKGELPDVLGPFGLGIRNDRGERLLQFAADNGLTLANSFFQHHPRRMYTWTSPDNITRNQIDFFLVKSRWRSSIKNVYTLPGADCGSDHQLLVAKFKLKLKAARKTTTCRRLCVGDTVKFKKALEKSKMDWPEQYSQNNNSVEQDWCKAKIILLDAVKASKVSEPPNTKRQHWMTDKTLALVEERRNLKASGGSQQAQNLLTTKIRTACRKDKNMFLQNICIEVETHAKKYETRDLHKKIRLITKKGDPRAWAIEDLNGKVVTNLDEVLEAWKTYCQSLFIDPEAHNCLSLDLKEEDLEPDILKEEVAAAIKHLKSGKALGNDNIPIEIVKCSGEYGIDLFHKVCNNIWKTGTWPQEWTHSVFVPLHKKGSTKKCGNYRLIALINHSSKILLHILNERLKAYISKDIAPEQAGFVRGKGTREQILILRQIIEKAREFNRPSYICFVDFQKAFDSVKWPQLWEILLRMGTPYHLVHLLRALYETNSASVKVDNVMSGTLHPSAGVRQGCILSPLLFNIYTEHIMRIALEEWTDGIPIGGKNISNLRYADDTTLLATSEHLIAALLRRVETTSLEFGLKINRQKTKMMVVDRNSNNTPTIIENCEVVPSYTYLGSLVSNVGGSEEEIRRRIAIARCTMDRLTKIWKDRNITRATKTRLVKSLVFPVLLYGAETWTVKERERRRIDALEMWCWRRMLRISWTKRRTNTSILQELSIKQRLSAVVHSRILKYYGHVMRKANDSMDRLVVQGRVNGSRSRGRSPLRWTDQIKNLTESSLNTCVRDASIRERWRETVRNAVRQPP